MLKFMEFTKDAAYYEQLDKRTKEYRDYKAFMAKQSKGLGDNIAKFTEKTGLKVVAEKVAEAFGFEDCGCDERREKLNGLIRYKNPKCLEKDEFMWLAEWFDKKKNVITHKEQEKMLVIYNRVFSEGRQPTSCSTCIREVIVRLEKLMNAHKA